MGNYEPLGGINFQGGLNTSAALLSPLSQNTLSDGSWNHILSGDGEVRPWKGATSQGANTGGYISLPFANTWATLKSLAYIDKTFSAPSAVTTNTVAVSSTSDYVTGLPCTVSTPGTLPTGLAALTTYYLIIQDSTHLKFATSVTNALLGTAVSITTTTGSGTITIDVSNTAVTASGNAFQDIGQSRWFIGSGQLAIEGLSVPGAVLTTNLQVQIASNGVYAAPVQAGLSQPSAPEIGIIQTSGTVTNSVAAKLERSRPSTGAISLASPSSAVIIPQANRVRVTFPLAQAGQTHWRVFFTLMGFGGTGVYYLTPYGTLTDIPEATVAANSAAGSRATGSLTVAVNPSVAETLVVNGVTLTFIAGASTATDVHIGASAADTADNLAAVLAASLNVLLLPATYTAAGGIVSITYDVDGVVGNAFTLANSSGANVTRSAATLTGGVDGIARSLEFNWQDGDLIPIEASFDDYPPPAATHALRLNTVMTLPGCYADSTTDPTSTNPGTCIAISKENNYESYVPTSLLYLPEQVVDVLARPLDDYGYIGCQNSISAIQYVGNRGDELPSCTITTILPDIGVQYPHNWCHFRGQLLIYTAQGSLMLMDDTGSFDTTFANPVSKILKGFTTVATAVGYHPPTDSIVVMNGKMILVYSMQAQQWRQIWMPDFGLTGTAVSCVAAKRNLYFTLNNVGANTAYSYDTGSATAPLSFVSNYQNSGGIAVRDIYEMAIAAQTDVATRLAVVINRNLTKTVFRQIQTTNGNVHVTDSEASFTSNMVGKSYIIFGADIGLTPGTVLLQGTVLAYNSASDITIATSGATAPQATLADCLMFVGNFATSVVFSATGTPPNIFPNLPELKAYQVAVWLKGQTVGNCLTVDLMGSVYSSGRALA